MPAAFCNKIDAFCNKKLPRFVITFYRVLLQNAASIIKRVDFITKCGRYYKTRHLLQNGAQHV